MKVDKKISSRRSNWKFDKKVVSNFETHIKQSVPFYQISHDLTKKLSDFFLKENSNCYDLGCSTGNLLKEVHKRHKTKNVNFYGFDDSKEMINKAKRTNNKSIKFSQTKLEKIKFKKSDLIISLYTIQFVQPKFRQKLFDKIYDSLNWGGALIIFEKVRGNDARFQDIMNFLYFDFKQENGLSAMNILNKELSLRSVLEPYTINENLNFLKRAGFKDIMPIAQYLCFKGFLAIK